MNLLQKPQLGHWDLSELVDEKENIIKNYLKILHVDVKKFENNRNLLNDNISSQKFSEMIRLSINALQTREKNTVSNLYKMDDSVDALYTNYLKDLITLKTDSNDHPLQDPRCAISALLIMRYLERIADHACYIGDSVYFIATGESSPRK